MAEIGNIRQSSSLSNYHVLGMSTIHYVSFNSCFLFYFYHCLERWNAGTNSVDMKKLCCESMSRDIQSYLVLLWNDIQRSKFRHKHIVPPPLVILEKWIFFKEIFHQFVSDVVDYDYIGICCEKFLRRLWGVRQVSDVSHSLAVSCL